VGIQVLPVLVIPIEFNPAGHRLVVYRNVYTFSMPATSFIFGRPAALPLQVTENQIMFALSRRQLLLAPLFSLAPSKLTIVAAGGHPGDPEYGCGGTMARYADLGHDVVLLYLNRGEKNCPDTPGDPGSKVRVPEAQKASEILKARPVFAGQCDGNAIIDPAHYDSFNKLLAGLAPDILFTQWPIDNHPDHRAIANLVYQGWLSLRRKPALYFYEVSDGEDTVMFPPTDYVDISGVEQRKRAACYAHASQTPDRYYALQTDVTRFRGIESGYPQAEAFVRHVRSPRGFLPGAPL
jgi:N-acetylglucosamine malate deacetylase 1